VLLAVKHKDGSRSCDRFENGIGFTGVRCEPISRENFSDRIDLGKVDDVADAIDPQSEDVTVAALTGMNELKWSQVEERRLKRRWDGWARGKGARGMSEHEPI
jgi:hypothetical protein